jgi:soluble lytic murein transglycosylase-like protein
MHPNGANACIANGDDATRDLRFWRPEARSDWKRRIFGLSRFAMLPLISAAVLFAAQSFVARVQYFDAVSTSHSMPIATSLARFVRTTLGLAPVAPPSAYVAEMQMSPSTLLSRWDPLIESASRQFGIPKTWIRTVMQMESGGRTMSSEYQPITSHAGAMGLMQVMPDTYAEMRAQYRLGANAYDPHDNVFAGAAYLRWLHGKYGFPAMFAAYNDGPGHFEDRRQSGAALPVETQNYVSRIAATLGGHAGAITGAPRGRLVRLTRPNGEPVSIAAADVASVRAALPGEYAPGVNTVIAAGRERQGVRESVAEVDTALRSPRRIHMAGLGHRISVSYAMRS